MVYEIMESPIEVLDALILKKLRELKILELGVVTSVFPHSDSNDKDNYECNLMLLGEGEGVELRRVPIATQHIGLTNIPNVGDLVLVAFVRGDSNFPVVIGRLYNDEDRPPINKEGEIVLSSDTLKRMRIKMRGGLRITITGNSIVLNTGKASINIDKDGNVKIDTDGEIIISSKKGIEIKSIDKVSIKSNSINIEGDTEFNIKANARGSINVGGNLELKGGIVKIN